MWNKPSSYWATRVPVEPPTAPATPKVPRRYVHRSGETVRLATPTLAGDPVDLTTCSAKCDAPQYIGFLYIYIYHYISPIYWVYNLMDFAIDIGILIWMDNLWYYILDSLSNSLGCTIPELVIKEQQGVGSHCPLEFGRQPSVAEFWAWDHMEIQTIAGIEIIKDTLKWGMPRTAHIKHDIHIQRGVWRKMMGSDRHFELMFAMKYTISTNIIRYWMICL